MMDERKPDESITIQVDGHKVVAYSYGVGDEVLFCINGGPGLPCDYVRDSHSWLADKGYRVVAYDQLGTGNSDKPKDDSLWTVERYTEEAETVRAALNLGNVHLYGQSWGTWIGIEYALTYQENFKTLTLSNGAANIPHLANELKRLRLSLGPETEAMMQRHEAEGSEDHAEYQAAVTVLNYRHVCRLDVWPNAVNRSFEGMNLDPYKTIWGPNEFTVTGNLKDWNRIPDLARISQPALVLCGQHDHLSPECSYNMHDALPNSRIKVIENSSHLSMWEQPDVYFTALLDFLDAHRG